MICVLLGIGSNIEPEHHILSGVKELRKLDQNCQFSHVYESEPVGFKGNNFYNLAAKLHTNLDLASLVAKIKEIEYRYGRSPEAKKFSDRTLDIDLLTYGDLCQEGKLSLPRADIYQYPFVLFPLVELCPDKLIPGDNLTFAKLWDRFPKEQVITLVRSFEII